MTATDLDDPPLTCPPPTAAHVLTGALARSQAERSATETLVETSRVESLRVLYPAWLEATAHITAHAGDDRRADVEQLRAELDRLNERNRRGNGP